MFLQRLIVFLSVADIAYSKDQVNVYSYRQPILINPFFGTGIFFIHVAKVNAIQTSLPSIVHIFS